MPKPPTRTQSPPWLWIGLGAIVLLALVAAVAVSATGGDDEADVPEGVEQVRSVTVEGDALPQFPGGGGNDPGVGELAPELRGAGFDGGNVQVARDGRGKVVVFLAHWCPHCQAEVPVIVEHLAGGYELPDDVDLVAVSTAVDESQPNFPPSAWLDEERWTAPVLVDDADGAAANAFGLTGFPYLVALDPDGRVVGRISGEFPMPVFEALAEAAAG